MEHVERFAQVIIQAGVHCTVRRPRGQGKNCKYEYYASCVFTLLILDIMAACGQLKSSEEKKNRVKK